MVKYDYVIEMNTASEQSNAILRKIGAPKNVRYLSKYRHTENSSTLFQRYYSEISDEVYSKICDMYKFDYKLFGIECPVKPK